MCTNKSASAASVLFIYSSTFSMVVTTHDMQVVTVLLVDGHHSMCMLSSWISLPSSVRLRLYVLILFGHSFVASKCANSYWLIVYILDFSSNFVLCCCLQEDER
jgi:hypothetical protein